MKLHNDRENFSDLIALTAEYIGIPQAAVRRDCYIVRLLQNLQNSEFADQCVFKGGTSDCYLTTVSAQSVVCHFWAKRIKYERQNFSPVFNRRTVIQTR
jgi:predicted nucleotidyltransferase component of viral defense system